MRLERVTNEHVRSSCSLDTRPIPPNFTVLPAPTFFQCEATTLDVFGGVIIGWRRGGDDLDTTTLSRK